MDEFGLTFFKIVIENLNLEKQTVTMKWQSLRNGSQKVPFPYIPLEFYWSLKYRY